MATRTSPFAVESDSLPSIVLLVADDRDILDVYATYFEMSGLWVATSTVPAEALDVVNELEPDVIVVVADGRPAGLELIHTLKSGSDTREIPVIVLGGGGLFGLPLEVQQAADALLEEPVLPDRLLENVRNLLCRCRVPAADPTIAGPESG